MCEKNKNLSLTEDHHRRGRSIGGTKSVANISKVDPVLHDCYNIIFGNMNAYQTCNYLNQSKNKPPKFKLICKFINGSEVHLNGKRDNFNKKVVDLAWKKLFNGMSFNEIIEYINNVWLDPSYHIYIEILE